ncbi:MAG: FMN-binding protein [Thermoleophilia bacterium]|nr:FMN-binding protein [Thermoleophilia bacterium]
MGRAPIVITSTLAGLALVLGYHPRSGGSAAAGTAVTLADAGTHTATPTATATVPAPATTTKATSATGSVQDISENGREFGSIQVTATVTGGKVTNVAIAALQAYDGRSQSIDEYAVPQLQQQTLDAGTARIDGVSGATYTSQAYETSLQAALDQLAV